MNILDTLSFVLLRVVWVFGVLFLQSLLLTVCLQNRCIRASRQLEKLLREQVYPRLALPGKLRDILDDRLLSSWRQEKECRRGKPLPPPSVNITPEREKKFGYFARTGRLICDRQRSEPLTRWYQPEDWVRDIVAGEATEETICQPVQREKTVPKGSGEQTAPTREQKTAENAG